ncbi:MAG: hypothetical protein KAG84_07995 [Bacteroidales bacterium]|nr:hypothetical protein [Bacteroidales bacterium]
MDNDKYLDWTERIAETEAYHFHLLEGFELWMEEKGYSSNDIKGHIQNIGFFANQYLLRSDIHLLNESSKEVIPFLQSYFIDKCQWANKESMKNYFSSFRNIYTYLAEINKINEDELSILKSDLELNKEPLIQLV